MVVGIFNQRDGNRKISGHSYAKFIRPEVAKTMYVDAVHALGVSPGPETRSGKPHYYFTFNVNLLPSGSEEGFVWRYKPGFVKDSFQSAPNPVKQSKNIEEALAKLGWRARSGESIETFIKEATDRREKDVTGLQADALECGEKKYCLEYKEQQLVDINDKPLEVDFYLVNEPYTLNIGYVLYPLDETAKLGVSLVYGCEKPSNDYCHRN